MLSFPFFLYFLGFDNLICNSNICLQNLFSINAFFSLSIFSEIQIHTQVLSNSQVIACTLTGAASDDVHRLPAGFFDLVVIDECAQALESACWIALLRCGVLRAERGRGRG